MLFNKDNTGGKELRHLLGFLDADTNFEKWITWVRLSVKQITSLTGKKLYNRAKTHYEGSNYAMESDDVNSRLVRKFQLANALFAYVKLLPSLDAGHGNDGRKRQLGEHDKSLSALEAYKDETNILNLAYEALEDLIDFAEEEKLQEWLDSDNRKSSERLFVRNTTEFNRYYMLNSTRMYFHLVPLIREVQETQIRPIITADRYDKIQEALSVKEPDEEQKKWISFAQDYICRPLVFASLVLALKRLPVELFPDGLMQTQLVGTLREKRIATEEVRKSLISSFDDDAERAIDKLQAQIEILDGADVQERYVIPPSAKETIKGFLM